MEKNDSKTKLSALFLTGSGRPPTTSVWQPEVDFLEANFELITTESLWGDVVGGTVTSEDINALRYWLVDTPDIIILGAKTFFGTHANNYVGELVQQAVMACKELYYLESFSSTRTKRFYLKLVDSVDIVEYGNGDVDVAIKFEGVKK